jgi:excisionase family DNA binding protein
MTISIIKNHSGDPVGIITGCYAQLDHSYTWAKHSELGEYLPAAVKSIKFVNANWLAAVIATPTQLTNVTGIEGEVSIPDPAFFVPALTLKDVQAKFSISERTVYNWIAKGVLHPYRIGTGGNWRFPAGEVARLLRR